MRVPTITIYKQATYHLNRLTCDLNEANEVVSTECRINDCSDDPAGMAQVLDINSSICSITQCQANVQQGQIVLTAAETSLDAMADLLLDLNLLCSQLANASAGTQERTDAADSMQVYLDQLLDLANTEAYGGYVFAGDENQTAPFCYDDPDNPSCVTYTGSDTPYCVKTGKDTLLAMDCCGCELFYEDSIIVDEGNNQILLLEDPGTGTENILTIEAFVPSGTYTREELARLVENTMTQASLEQGFAVGYQVAWDETDNAFSIGTLKDYQGSMTTTLTTVQTEMVRIAGLTAGGGDYPDMDIEITSPSRLTQFTPEPEGTAPLTLTYSEAGKWTIENDPGYGLPVEITGDEGTLELDVDDDGVTDIRLSLNSAPEPGTTVSFDIVPGFENNSILGDLGFVDETVTIAPAQSNFEVAASVTVVAGENDAVDFIETLSGEDQACAQLTAFIEPGVYPDPDAYARAVEGAMESASATQGNRVNYEVIYDAGNQTFTIREDTQTGRQLESFDLLFSNGTHNGSSAAADLGFYSQDIHSGPVQGDTATWSIFDTLFDLETALAKNDVDGIQKAMIRLENHYTSITSGMASVGTARSSLTATQSTASDTELTLVSQRTDVQGADTVEAIMNLSARETAYEAALSSCSKIMDLSLVDYL